MKSFSALNFLIAIALKSFTVKSYFVALKRTGNLCKENRFLVDALINNLKNYYFNLLFI